MYKKYFILILCIGMFVFNTKSNDDESTPKQIKHKASIPLEKWQMIQTLISDIKAPIRKPIQPNTAKSQ